MNYYRLKYHMKKILLITNFFIIMNGCSLIATPSNIQSNIYFDSNKAAKELFVVYVNYLKYHKYIPPLDNINQKYYYNVNMNTDSGVPNKINEIVLEQEISKEKHKQFEKKYGYQVLYYKNNKLLYLVNPYEAITSFYDKEDQNISIEFLNGYSRFFYSYSNMARCSKNDIFQTTVCTLQSRKYNEEQGLLSNYKHISYRKKEIEKIFNRYKHIYHNKNIIKNALGKIVKVVDYKRKKIVYYFYEKDNVHEVVCDYLYKECMIESKLKGMEDTVDPYFSHELKVIHNSIIKGKPIKGTEYIE